MEQLLQQLKIQRIISIDDSWEKNTEENDLELGVLEYCEAHGIKIKKEEIEEIEDLDNGSFKELKNQNPDLFNKIYRYKNREHDEALKKLEEIFSGKLKKYPSIEKFKKDLKNINPSEFILFIIDINMEKTDGERNSVLNLLEIIEKDYKNISIVIYSNEDKEIDRLQNLSKRKEFLEKKGKSIKYMTLIHPIRKGHENLVEGLKEKVVTSYLYVVLNNYLEEKKKIDNIIYNGIYCSELYEFHKKLSSVLSSGETVTDLLRRLFHSLYDKTLVTSDSYLEKRKELIKTANIYERNVNIKDEKITEWSPNSLIDFSINKVYKDIYSGDLFQIEIGDEIKYGIIISKSCHLILRGQKRNGANIEDRSLDKKKVKMLIFNKEDINSKSKITSIKKEVDKGKAIWPYKVEADKSIALKTNNEIMYFDDFLLDLATLSSTGKSEISSNFDIIDTSSLEYKTKYSRIYFDKLDFNLKLNNDLKEAFLKFKNKEEKDLTDEENKFILKELLKDLSKQNNMLKIDNTDEKINFGLKRIGRLHDDKTLFVYQNYLFEISQRGIDGAL